MADMMEQVIRERLTEERIRRMDTADLVEEIHRLEDQLESAQMGLERMQARVSNTLSAARDLYALAARLRAGVSGPGDRNIMQRFLEEACLLEEVMEDV